jgi:predicted nucleotidyltransferase
VLPEGTTTQSVPSHGNVKWFTELKRFCEKHRIERPEIFGSAARGEAGPGSDVDLLVTLEEWSPVSAAELLEMAGEAEEVVSRPVDFVLPPSLEKSPNRSAREHILSTAVCVYGGDQLGLLRDILEASRLIASYMKEISEVQFRRHWGKESCLRRTFQLAP